MSFWKNLITKLKKEKSVEQILREKSESNQNLLFKKGKPFDRKLTKSASRFARLFDILSRKHTTVDEKLFEEISDLLISFDVGYAVTEQIVNASKKEVHLRNIQDFEEIKQILLGKLFLFYLHDSNVDVQLNYVPGRVNVFLVVGVNGVGKTSTIAKIAYRFFKEQKRVLLVAGDTFRAAACEQLAQWAQRIGCDIFLPKHVHQDSASVIYEGISQAVKENYDLVICDTSGRQQNKKNLMAELTKIRNVIARFVPNSPHETLLVIDATTGQSGLKQAAVFNESTKVTGIVLTKLDSTSKGGIIFAIKEALNISVKLICFGEKLDDIAEFDLEEYLAGLLQFIDDRHQENEEQNADITVE